MVKIAENVRQNVAVALFKFFAFFPLDWRCNRDDRDLHRNKNIVMALSSESAIKSQFMNVTMDIFIRSTLNTRDMAAVHN